MYYFKIHLQGLSGRTAQRQAPQARPRHPDPPHPHRLMLRNTFEVFPLVLPSSDFRYVLILFGRGCDRIIGEGAMYLYLLFS